MYAESIVAVKARADGQDIRDAYGRGHHDAPFWSGFLVRDGLVLTAVRDVARGPGTLLHVRQASPLAAHPAAWQQAELVWKSPWDNDPGRGTMSVYPNPPVRCALPRIGPGQPRPYVTEKRPSEVSTPPQGSALTIGQAVDGTGVLRAEITTGASLSKPAAIYMDVRVPADDAWTVQDEIFGAPIFSGTLLIGVATDTSGPWTEGAVQEVNALSMQRFPF